VSRLDEVREQLPGAAQIATRFALDNAGPAAVTLAGMIVLNQLAVRAVRPRTPAAALALFVVLVTAEPLLVQELVKRGVLKFTIRDPHGCRHDLGELLRLGDLLGDADADRLPAQA
jgi:hypothetical protein